MRSTEFNASRPVVSRQRMQVLHHLAPEPALNAVGKALAAIGRRGTEGFALSIFLGLALPWLAERARPVLPVTIFCFTTVVFMRAPISA